MDSDGISIQEFCTIMVDIDNLDVLTIYHKFAYASGDIWSRRNIHGLNTDYLYKFEFSNGIMYHALCTIYKCIVSIVDMHRSSDVIIGFIYLSNCSLHFQMLFIVNGKL